MVPVSLPALRRDGPGAKEQLEPDQRAMGCRSTAGAWSVVTPEFARILGARCVPGLFGVADSIVDAVRRR